MASTCGACCAAVAFVVLVAAFVGATLSIPIASFVIHNEWDEYAPCLLPSEGFVSLSPITWLYGLAIAYTVGVCLGWCVGIAGRKTGDDEGDTTVVTQEGNVTKVTVVQKRAFSVWGLFMIAAAVITAFIVFRAPNPECAATPVFSMLYAHLAFAILKGTLTVTGILRSVFAQPVIIVRQASEQGPPSYAG